jgi:hypothetical protein
MDFRNTRPVSGLVQASPFASRFHLTASAVIGDAWPVIEAANTTNNARRLVTGLTRMSSATGGVSERGLKRACFHKLVRSIGTASGSLQRLVRWLGRLPLRVCGTHGTMK